MLPSFGYVVGPLKVMVTGLAKTVPSGPRRKAPAIAPRAVFVMGVIVISVGAVKAPGGTEIDSAPSGVETTPPSSDIV
jgi:hypothetical protein